MQINEEYFKSEEFRELLDSYEASINAGNSPFMDADDFVDLADYYTYYGDVDEADEAIGYALDLYPEATLPNVYKARQALMQGEFSEAEQWAQQISDHDDPDYHYLQAEIMIAKGQLDKADRYLRDYAKTVDDDEYEDFIKDCANLFIDYGYSEKSYEWMMRSKGDNSDDFKELMGRTLFGLGKYKDSERIFNELIDHNPFSKHYWNALASAQLMNEDYSGAITSSEYAIAIDPKDPDSINSKANGLFRLGNYEEAAKYFERYANMVPDSDFAMLHQGICLMNLGRAKEAQPILEHSLEINMESGDPIFRPQIFQELAFCYSDLGQPERAQQMLDEADQMDCDHVDIQILRGHIWLQHGELSKAEKAFTSAIVNSDHNPSTLLRIIVSLYDNRYFHAAYEMLLKFFKFVNEFEPDYKGGYSYMARCCLDLGKQDEFKKYLKLAVELNPSEARQVLGSLFPDGTDVQDYYKYVSEK